MLRNNRETYIDSEGKSQRINDPEAYISRLHHFYNSIGMSRELDPDVITNPKRTTHIGRMVGLSGSFGDVSVNTSVQDEGFLRDHSFNSLYGDRPRNNAGNSRNFKDEMESEHRGPYEINYGHGTYSVAKTFTTNINPKEIDLPGGEKWETDREDDDVTYLRKLSTNKGLPGVTSLQAIKFSDDDLPVHTPGSLTHYGEIEHEHRGQTADVPAMLNNVREIFNAINLQRQPGATGYTRSNTVPNAVRRNSPHLLSPQFLRVYYIDNMGKVRNNRDVIDLETGNWAKIDPEGYFPD